MSILEIILISYIGLMWVVVVLGVITPKGKFSNTMFMLLVILIPPILPPIFIGIVTDSIVATIKRKKNKKRESESVEND